MAGMIRAQARRIGMGLLTMPVACGIAVVAAGIMVSGVWSRTQTLTVVNWLAQLMVIGAGVCVAVALTGDPLVEASESTPVGWRRVQATRFALAAVSGLAGAVLMFAPLHVLGLWPQDTGWISLIAPTGAVLVVGAAGFAAAAWSASTRATVMAGGRGMDVPRPPVGSVRARPGRATRHPAHRRRDRRRDRVASAGRRGTQRDACEEEHMNMHIGFPRLIRVHMIIVWRQRSLWAAAVPLALFALLLGVISPAGPHDHGAGDLAFMAKTMAMFMPIAYMAAFTDFHTRHDRLGIGQLEDSTPTPAPLLTAARTLGAFLILITPSLLLLACAGVIQTLHGSWRAIPQALAAGLAITGPAVLTAMSLSSLLGAILPMIVARIAGVLAWFALVFSSPMLPVPTINGTILNVIGDAVGAGWFGLGPVYPATGGILAVTGTPANAAISLIAQLVIAVLLMALGGWCSARPRTTR